MSRHVTNAGRRKAWLESCVITLAGPILGMRFQPADPFWLQASMPWLVLVPLLCGAQHGLVHALFSSALLSALAFGHLLGIGHAADVSFAQFCIGGLIAGVIAGQFRDVHARRQQGLRDDAVRLTERLERAERTGQILTVSHSRLEERLAAMRWSLAGALAEAQRRMASLTTRRELGETLLEVLASQAQVQAASLYWIASDKLFPAPMALLGDAAGSSQLHPLVKRAWTTRRLTSLADARVDGSAVLAAVPVVTSGGQAVGVVAIHQMSFMAFQTEQLSQLMVMAGQLGDMVHERLQSLPLLVPVTEAVGERISVELESQDRPTVPAPLGELPAGWRPRRASLLDITVVEPLPLVVARVFESPN